MDSSEHDESAAEEVDEHRDNWELPNGGYRVIGDAEMHDETQDDADLDNAHGIKASRVTQPSRPAQPMERREAPERKGFGKRAAAFGARASQSMRDVTASLSARRDDEYEEGQAHREPVLGADSGEHDEAAHGNDFHEKPEVTAEDDSISVSSTQADNLEPMAEIEEGQDAKVETADVDETPVAESAAPERKEPALEVAAAPRAEVASTDDRHPLVVKAERNKVDDELARDTLADASEVIIISVMARGDDGFSGEDVLGISLACGLRHSDMGLFLRHEEDDDDSPLQFAMANVVKPGIFAPAEMVDTQLDGVTFLMPLPGADDTSAAFETMVEIAMLLVRRLGAELKDENHSVMTAQTIEFKRQQVHEFERRNRLHRYQAN